MISYKPLQKTMETKGITYYQLSYKYGLNPRTVQRLRKKDGISSLTIDRLCRILKCKVEDVMEYVEDEEEWEWDDE